MSSCWEVDYLRIQCFQLLQGDGKAPQTDSSQVLLALHWDPGRWEPFSLTGPKMAAAALPVVSSAPLLIPALLLLFTAAIFDCFMDEYS